MRCFVCQGDFLLVVQLKSFRIAVARRFGSLQFVAFGLLFKDVMLKHVRPMILKVQGHREPWVLESAIAFTKDKLADGLAKSLMQFQQFLAVSAHLSCYCTAAEIGRWSLAWSTSEWAKAFPAMAVSWRSLLYARTFAKCKLTWSRPELEPGLFLAAPRCQCLWRLSGQVHKERNRHEEWMVRKRLPEWLAQRRKDAWLSPPFATRFRQYTLHSWETN